MKNLMIVLLAMFAVGCASKTKGKLVTNSEWTATTVNGGQVTVSPGQNTAVTLSQSNDKTILIIPYKDQEIQVPLKISEQAYKTDGSRNFSALEVGQRYNLAIHRHTEMKEGAKASDYVSCKYMDSETQCAHEVVKDSFSDTERTEYKCQSVPVEKSGSQWVHYTPVRKDSFLKISFLEPQANQQVAVFLSQETQESKMDQYSTSCF